MRIDLVGRTPDDVDVAAIGFPAGNAGGEVFIGVRDATVVLFFEFVDGGIGIGIAALEDDFDELFAFFVGAESVEGGAFLRSDDVDQVFFDDVLETVAEFVFGSFDLFFALFFGLGFLRGGRRSRTLLSECMQTEQEDCGRRENRKAHESPLELDVGRETLKVRRKDDEDRPMHRQNAGVGGGLPECRADGA